ncbi:MAG: hypothetical protein FJ319_12245 [SAR202 cluster bacterium]|nr:hypothetical protein [SAR202 cluster bacterium]
MTIPSSNRAGITISTPMAPPQWALLERELFRAHVKACKEFYAKYYDERGYLQMVPRWGGNDGPDDAMESMVDWPTLHFLGGDDSLVTMYKHAWEGHLKQYTEAKTKDIDFARDGMYYKEFPVMFDWQHNGEGLTVFNLQGLSDPYDTEFQRRVKKYAGFYMNEDPQAPNYDPKHKIIRSSLNGSRGPMLRKATGLDWAGDPIEVEGRFKPRHHERTYAEMVAHYKDYNDVPGDHPQNMVSTGLGFHAYALTGDPKYKAWVIEYVDAWLERMEKNGGIIPSNIGLDGVPGSAANGKWYGGVYGWSFTVVQPHDGKLANRNMVQLGLAGIGNAYQLTGDKKYPEAWAKMLDIINSNEKVVDGQKMYPSMYGENGWYAFLPRKWNRGAEEVYYWTMDRKHLSRVDTTTGWYGFLEGNNPNFPVESMQRDLLSIRQRVEGMRKDDTTADTRLSDDPMVYNPVFARSLFALMMGGPTMTHARPVSARLRYFDPARRRAGIPEDCAALIEKLADEETVVTLINLSASEDRTVVVQGGSYAEHQMASVTVDGVTTPVNSSQVTINLGPVSGARMTIKMKRNCNPPTFTFPWDRKG